MHKADRGSVRTPGLSVGSPHSAPAGVRLRPTERLTKGLAQLIDFKCSGKSENILRRQTSDLQWNNRSPCSFSPEV